MLNTHLHVVAFSYDTGNKSTKGASKMRRDSINHEINKLRDLLPIPASARQRLSQLQLMALILVYVRKTNYFEKRETQSPSSTELLTSYQQLNCLDNSTIGSVRSVLTKLKTLLNDHLPRTVLTLISTEANNGQHLFIWNIQFLVYVCRYVVKVLTMQKS